jgi:hypothetical protein
VSFDVRDLRLGMDVFSSDGVYLGSVIHVARRPRSDPTLTAAARLKNRATGPSFSGETLGPMPTTRLGNRGPAHEQEPSDYATRLATQSDSEPAELVVFRCLVALDWRTLWPRLRRYPVSLVLHTSHERIVLAATAAELDS